jgi:hypothetical protein
MIVRVDSAIKWGLSGGGAPAIDFWPELQFLVTRVKFRLPIARI